MLQKKGDKALSTYRVNKTTGEEDTLISGGTNFSDTPIGTILPFGSNNIPSSFLLCDGTELNRADYPELFAVIGTSFGTPSVNTKFKLPDLREATTKGVGLTGKSNNHYDADGLALGEFIDDRLQNVTGFVGQTGYDLNPSGAFYQNGVTGGFQSGDLDFKESYFDASRVARTGVTTEVKAVGVNYIIKAVQTPVPADFMSKVDEVVEEAMEDVTDVIPSVASESNKLVANSQIIKWTSFQSSIVDLEAGKTGYVTVGAGTTDRKVVAVGGVSIVGSDWQTIGVYIGPNVDGNFMKVNVRAVPISGNVTQSYTVRCFYGYREI